MFLWFILARKEEGRDGVIQCLDGLLIVQDSSLTLLW